MLVRPRRWRWKLLDLEPMSLCGAGPSALVECFKERRSCDLERWCDDDRDGRESSIVDDEW